MYYINKIRKILINYGYAIIFFGNLSLTGKKA